MIGSPELRGNNCNRRDQGQIKHSFHGWPPSGE
jgi:hypothetical protein